MSEPSILDDLRRLRAHLPDENDMTLIILKGHLLLKECIEQTIRAIIAHGDLLASIRLSFAQKAALARDRHYLAASPPTNPLTKVADEYYMHF